MTPASRALEAMKKAMGGAASFQAAELALTLHMLQFLAPKFFEEHALGPQLDEALGALGNVPARFGPTLDTEEAMARLDALYLRAVRGLAVRDFQASEVIAAVDRAGEEGGPLWRWLMGALAARLGVTTVYAPQGRWPFKHHARTHLYHLTHVILIATEYLRTPVPAALSPELDELEAALPALVIAESWDLLAECVMCLTRAGRPVSLAVAALTAGQQADGSFFETGSTPRLTAHCTAAGLLALAGALDLERSAP